MSRPIDTSPKYEYESEEVVVEEYEARTLKVSLSQQQQQQVSSEEESEMFRAGSGSGAELARKRYEYVVRERKRLADTIDAFINLLNQKKASLKDAKAVQEIDSDIAKLQQLKEKALKVETYDDLVALEKEFEAIRSKYSQVQEQQQQASTEKDAISSERSELVNQIDGFINQLKQLMPVVGPEAWQGVGADITKLQELKDKALRAKSLDELEALRQEFESIKSKYSSLLGQTQSQQGESPEKLEVISDERTELVNHIDELINRLGQLIAARGGPQASQDVIADINKLQQIKDKALKAKTLEELRSLEQEFESIKNKYSPSQSQGQEQAQSQQEVSPEKLEVVSSERTELVNHIDELINQLKQLMPSVGPQAWQGIGPDISRLQELKERALKAKTLNELKVLEQEYESIRSKYASLLGGASQSTTTVQASVKQEMVSLPQQLAQAVSQAVGGEVEGLRAQLLSALARARIIVDAWLSGLGAGARSPSVVSKYYDYVNRINDLAQRVANAKTLDELNKLKQDVDALVSEVEKLRVDPKAAAQQLVNTYTRLAQEAKDENTKKALQQATDVYSYLANNDLSTIRKDVSLFYMLMDMARDDTYQQIYGSHRDSFQALLRVVSGNATFSDVEKSFEALAIIKQLKDQGMLDEKKVFDEYANAFASSDTRFSFLGDTVHGIKSLAGGASEVQQRFNEIESKVSSGVEPERKKTPSQVFAEAIAVADPTRYIYNLAFSGVKAIAKALGVDENTANNVADKVATGVTGAVAGAVGALAPPLGLAMAISATLDAVSDIASRLSNPIDKQLFLQYLQNNWQNLVVDTAIGIATSVAAGYAASKIKPAVYNRIADALEKLGAKDLANKVREAVAPTYAVQEKIPSERKWELQVKEDGTIVVQYQETGKLGKTIAEVKLGKDAAALFKDPATGSKIMEIVGNISDEDALKNFLNLVDKVSKTYGLDNAKALIDRISDAIKKGNLRGVALVGEYGGKVLVGDYSTVTIYDAKSGNAVATLPGDNILLLAPRSNPDAFNFFTVLHERGIDPVQAYDSMSDVISAIRKGSKLNVTYNLGSVKAVIDNGKLYLVDAKSNSVLAVVDPAKLSKVDLMAMSSELSRLSQAYGASAAKAVLDIAKAFGSLQTPAIPVYGYMTPETKFVIDLANSLPPAQKAATRSIATDKGVFIVIDQALADRAGNISRLSFAEAETFARNLLSTTYTDKYVAVVKLAPAILKYIKDAQALATGIKSPDELFGFASSLASAVGDSLAAQQLSQIALALRLASQNLLSTPLIAVSNDGMIIGVVASSQAVWEALSKASKALAEGKSDEAHATLVETLMRHGLSREQAASLAQSLIEQYIGSRLQIMAKGAEKGSEKTSYAGLASVARNNTLAVMRTLGLENKAGEVADKVDKALIKGDVDSARNVIIEALAPIYGYAVARLVADEVLASAVEGRKPRLDKYFYIREETVEAPLVIPAQVYESETRGSSATVKDRAVHVPVEKVETVEQTVSVPVTTYEAVERARTEATRDKAVYVPIVREEYVRLPLVVPQSVYDVIVEPRLETARDRIVYVPIVKEENLHLPLVLPLSVYEPFELQSSATTRDTVVVVPVTLEERTTSVVAQPMEVYESAEQTYSETARGLVLPIEKEVVVPVEVTVPVDVSESQLIQQTTSAPPSSTSTPLPAPPLPVGGGGGVLPGPEARYSPPKGRRELEGVEI